MTHASDRPVIEWDKDEFGGFRVTKNLDRFIAPGDWGIDPADPSHFVPKYKPCRYRRLSYGTRKGRPHCHIHCLLFEEVVDHQTCIDCTERVDPPNFVVLEDVIDVKETDTPEDIERKLNVWRAREYKNNAPYDPDDSEVISADLGENPDDNDPVFSRDQPPSRYVKKQPQQGTKWAPCIHRKQVENEDCGGCSKFICGCEECPLLGRTLNKKDCKECQHRSET